MRAKKDDDGFMSAEQQNHRFINVLQLIYLSSTENKGGSGYIIPSNVLSKVETELDFNTNEKTKSKIIWWDILSTGNYRNYDEAKSILMSIHRKTGGMHQSMTHVRYAMETMHLALDDHFDTNNLKITPSKFLTRKVKTRTKSKKKKVSKQNCPSPNIAGYNDLDFDLF
jgi:hypothetical protein